MPVLVRFIIKEFWKYFGFTFLVFAGIFFFADLIANTGLIFKYNAGFFPVMIYSALKIPEGLYYIVPISVLISSMLLFSILNRHFELISFRALGVPKKVFIFSLTACGMVVSMFSFFINEFVCPKSNYYARLFRALKIEKKTVYAVEKSDNIWYHKGDFVIRISFLFFDAGIMSNLTILKFDENFNLIKRIDADFAYRKGKEWKLVNPRIIVFDKGNISKFKKLLTMSMPVKLERSDFYVIEQKARNLNIFDLYRLITSIERTGVNPQRYFAEFANKMFYPFVCIIFSLLGFFLNIKPAKSGTILSVVLAIGLGAFYFVMNGFFVSIAKGGYINPFISASLTFFIYCGVIMCLNKIVKY